MERVQRVAGRRCDTSDRVTISVQDGRISAIEAADVDDSELDAADVEEVWVAPGFFDIQLNGYGGYDFNRGFWGDASVISYEIAPIFAAAARAGTPLACPTVTTNSHKAMCDSLAAIAQALDADPDLASAVPGLHVEGPYLSAIDGPRGAHSLEHIRPPNRNEFLSFQEAAGGRIKLLTLAPEVEGALEFIEWLTAAGVVVAIGHTAAEPETILEAVRAGARLSTHLGNGAHSLIRRHPNYIWEQLACDDLIASVIADGHHLPASVLKSIARVKGAERLITVSDAVSLGGLPPGAYTAGQHEVLPTGKVVLAGTPYLAGAGHLLDTGVATLLRATDLSLGEVIRTVTANPADLLGLGATKGRLAVGYDADLTLFRLPHSGPLEIVTTIRGGSVVYRREEA
jgi:N-acetylglucosamine-6-phosphate deacetylase